MIIVDTGPLVAALDADDADHDRCLHLLETYQGAFLQPATWPEALAAKAAHPEAVPIAGGVEIRLSLPNRHHLPVDLAPFDLPNANEVFVATDRPLRPDRRHGRPRRRPVTRRRVVTVAMPRQRWLVAAHRSNSFQSAGARLSVL